MVRAGAYGIAVDPGDLTRGVDSGREPGATGPDSY